MTDVAARNATARRRGKAWEREILAGCRALGIDTERTRDTGSNDEGDLVLRLGGKYIVIEAKNVAKLDPAGFTAEAVLEGKNFATHRALPPSAVHSVVFAKRRGRAFPEGYALLPITEYIRLAKAATK